jgi:hypothetical protein
MPERQTAPALGNPNPAAFTSSTKTADTLRRTVQTGSSKIMGQQQLLLLVLGIAIVALATVAGIAVFDEGAQKYEEDREHQAMLELVTKIQSWKLKPVIFGGGAGSADNDFSSFSLVSIGLKATSNPGVTPILEVDNVGCFRFFPAAGEVRINALDEDCTIGSWDKAIIVTGTTHQDIDWLYQ